MGWRSALNMLPRLWRTCRDRTIGNEFPELQRKLEKAMREHVPSKYLRDWEAQRPLTRGDGADVPKFTMSDKPIPGSQLLVWDLRTKSHRVVRVRPEDGRLEEENGRTYDAERSPYAWWSPLTCQHRRSDGLTCDWCGDGLPQLTGTLYESFHLEPQPWLRNGESLTIDYASMSYKVEPTGATGKVVRL